MNKLLLLVVVVVFLVVGGLVVHLGSDENEGVARQAPGDLVAGVDAASGGQAAQHVLTDAERDNYVNTVQTINARYRDLEARIAELLDQQARVEAELPTDKDIDEVVNRRISDSTNRLVRDFQERLNALKGDLEQRMSMGGSNRDKAPSSASAPSLPQGLGFDDLVTGGVAPSESSASPVWRPEWSTVLPMGADKKTSELADVGLGGVFSRLTQTTDAADAPVARQSSRHASVGAEPVRGKPAEPIPVYTIPRNATLFDNDTLTALLGVIPVEGSILDPIRFKLITGGTNLASNGLFIPGVKNIVWSGIAIGNREMSCVRGELHSVTFTFEDGTIHTVSASRASSDTRQRSKRILGYISDRRGSPCIEGLLITNASDYLRDRMIAAGAGATASAFSSTQERTVTRGDGSVERYFGGGDTGKYIGSKALSGGLAELSQYLAERSRNAVDLVYVEAGQQVVLHVEDQIDIDYDPNGRKLAHENPLSFADHNSTGLD